MEPEDDSKVTRGAAGPFLNQDHIVDAVTLMTRSWPSHLFRRNESQQSSLWKESLVVSGSTPGDLWNRESGGTLTEEGERDLHVPISRDKLQARKKTTVTHILLTITTLKY